MKIKLSKSQWERIGKTAGWMKVSRCMCGADDCERCHPGSTRVVECARCGELAQVCEAYDWDISEFSEDDSFCGECLEKIKKEEEEAEAAEED